MLSMYCIVFFFFFSSRRRHTRYWRDWSSDVCSSDLKDYGMRFDMMLDGKFIVSNEIQINIEGELIEVAEPETAARSEERRVGKECRYRGAPDREKKKKWTY